MGDLAAITRAVRSVLASGQAANLGGKTKTITFFSDLAGFTTLSEQMSPDAS